MLTERQVCLHVRMYIMEVIAYLSPDEQEKIKKTLDQYYSGDFRAIEGVLIAEIRELHKRVKRQYKQLCEQQRIIGDLEQREFFL